MSYNIYPISINLFAYHAALFSSVLYSEHIIRYPQSKNLLCVCDPAAGIV